MKMRTKIITKGSCTLLKFKTLRLMMALLLFSAGLQAAFYYVDDNNGNDSNPGTLASPFKTIQKASDVMGSGDICYIRAGVYRETIIPKDGQTFINFNNEYVLVTGCDEVSSGGWTLHSGPDIFKATVNSNVYDVFVEGENMNKAQYPDFGGDHMSNSLWASTTSSFVSSVDNKIVFSTTLPADFVGGWYNGKNGSNCFSGNLGNITSSSGNEIHITDVEYRQTYSNIAHFGTGSGYITNHLNCLTTAKEWHWQSNTLYLYAPGGGSPSTKKVEARVRIWGFDCTDIDNITIRGLNFKAASINMKGSDNCVIDACTFRYVSPWGNYKYPESSTQHLYYGFGGVNDGTSGIHVQGTYNTIKNCYIAHGWHGLVSIRGNNNTVHNNYIEDCGWMTREMGAGIILAGYDNTVANNTIRTGTAMLIGSTDIEGIATYRNRYNYNDLRHYSYIMVDGGHAAIYRNAGNDTKGTELSYNIIAHGHSAEGHNMGIYMDDGSQNFTVHHNVIFPGGTGAYSRGFNFHGNTNRQEDIFAYNNTIWDVGGTSIYAYNTGDAPKYTNIIYKNNLAQNNAWANYTTKEACLGNAPSNYFVNVTGEDFNFRLTSNAINAIDQGVVISGITDGYTNSKPDIGAYEFGGTDWTAGSTVNPGSIVFCDNNPADCGGTTLTIPSAPSGLDASAVSHKQVNLIWTDNSNNEDGFAIERKAGSGTFTLIKNTGENVIGYNDFNLAESTTYTYRVSAFNSAGNSGWSNESSDTTSFYAAELMLHWNFDETSGSAAFDASGNGNMGTLTNMETVDRISSLNGNALNFGGTDEYVANTSLNYTFEGDLSVAIWVKTTTIKNGGRLFDLSTSSNGLNVAYSSGKVLIDNGGGPIGEVRSNTHINDNAWHLVVVVRQNQDYILYVDNGEEEGRTSGNLVSYDRLYVGRRADAQSYTHFNGILDDVRLYNYALSQEEINSLFKNFSPVTPIVPANAKATPVSSHQINITWEDATGGEYSYHIEKLYIDTFICIGTTGPETGIFRDYSLPDNSPQTYRVRSLSGLGYSAYTEEISATTLVKSEERICKITSVATGKVIGLASDIIHLRLETWNEAEDQKWYIEEIGNGTFKLRNVYNGFELDRKGDAPSHVSLIVFSGSPDRFAVEIMNDDTVKIHYTLDVNLYTLDIEAYDINPDSDIPYLNYNGIGRTSQYWILEDLNNDTTSVQLPEGSYSGADMSVFPNPASESLIIEGPWKFSYFMYSSVGKLVRSGESSMRETLYVNGMVPGIYFIRLSAENADHVQKVVIE